MSALVLDVHIDGFANPAGHLSRGDNGNLAFAYSARHLTRDDALPLSLSLPVTDEPYGDVATRAFFGNLLQERDDLLERVMAREGLERADIAGLLFHLGRDCPGALSVLPQGAPPAKVPGDLATDYNVIGKDRLQRIVTELHKRRRLPQGTADPSPLAGMQSKIAITRLPDGRFAEPKRASGAPTTHILKVPDREHRRDALYESATLLLSRTLDFATAEAELLTFGGVEALLVRRFDRAIDAQGRIVRLHQEDFAQALALAPSLKYERNGAPDRSFDTTSIARVLNATADPIAARVWFLRATVFDLLTGNVDGHAKNFALLHLGAGHVEIAPRYDLLPTRLDPDLTEEFAYRIGAAKTLSALQTADLSSFVKALGIPTAAAQRRMLKLHIADLAHGFAAALRPLDQAGLKIFADLIAANMRHLLPLVGLEVPEAARNRDAAVRRGGGWQTS
ncbi:MAG: HipA domain-containing protein [Hyphomicrobiaceae bacterium]|nr:HipA domain-containing protein [Hyphomicrobiaceae bacterium]